MKMSERLKVWAKRIKRDGLTLWFARRHPQTPWYAKAVGAFVVAYALSPIDLIPDFIPVLGYLDDVLLLPALIYLAVRLLPPEVLRQCRREAEESMRTAASRPRSMTGAVLVVMLWAALTVALGLWILARL